MHSLISIVGIVLSSKENYQEWFRKIKNTLIFNDMWDDICETKDETKMTVSQRNLQMIRSLQYGRVKTKRLML
jgi:hypothetical protein